MVILLFQTTFTSKWKESWEEVIDANSTLVLVRYLYLIAGLSFISSFLFEIDWLSIPALISIIGILIAHKKERKEAPAQVMIMVGLVMLLTIFFVPTHPDSFMKHVNSKGTYECLYDFECVKITSTITSDGLVKTEAEVIPVTDYSSHWYGITATGSMVIGESNQQQETIQAFNIAGFWIEY
ncbi:hypothetical protein KR50_09850 [Jeotgalibacillus campisalis]|uniref:Uncharacterized protein n=2 Tax=Jeotgalibacillus campisalis TaxID=220754 RepID=A0A0C2SAY8_9BACL|nr:hypothetical protein KR50_09850 [Jeotgalibacillus campisalis]